MTGEDNVLLGQLNNYSVVTDGPDTVIAAANTRHFFRLIAELGSDFTAELRKRTKRKLDHLFSAYYASQLENQTMLSSVKQIKEQSVKLNAG